MAETTVWQILTFRSHGDPWLVTGLAVMFWVLVALMVVAVFALLWSLLTD